MTTIKQAYTAATPTEREELIGLILQRIQNRKKYSTSRLRPWISRPASAHYIGDQRQTNHPWWPFEPPTHQRTPFVIASSLLGMTAVIAASLTTASYHAEGLLMIPVYGTFLIIVLSRRQARLNMAS